MKAEGRIRKRYGKRRDRMEIERVGEKYNFSFGFLFFR
jgi:hypothetical protein